VIKKPWGAQSDDGREGYMEPNKHTSWHYHEKDTRVWATGLMYCIEQTPAGDIHVRSIPPGGLTIPGENRHVLFSCGETAMFKEKGTNIVEDITRLPWPNWADKIIGGVRDSHRGEIAFEVHLPDVPTEGYGRREVSGVTNSADVTTLT
jgi:hypothetical protein